MELRLKSSAAYYILAIATVVAFFVNSDSVSVPIWGCGIGALTLVWAAIDQSWKAFKKQGKAAILTSLKPAEGGHSTIHPDDKTISVTGRIPGEESTILPRFMVFATGGFVHGGVEWRGYENFIVCPPEYCEDTASAFICHATLRRVDFDDLPDYIQEELLKLKYFSRAMVKAQKNLWFGMTSPIDGTSTSDNLAKESNLIDQTYIINELKKRLKDKETILRKSEGGKNESITLHLPPRE